MIKIKTKSLSEAVSKAIKGSSKKQMLAITMSIGIEIKDDTLTLTTTDGVTDLFVRVDKIGCKGNNFYCCTDSELFSKLVQKISNEEITLQLTESALKVFAGKSEYNLPIILDEEGNMCRIDERMLSADSTTTKLSSEILRRIKKYNGATVALFTLPEDPSNGDRVALIRINDGNWQVKSDDKALYVVSELVPAVTGYAQSMEAGGRMELAYTGDDRWEASAIIGNIQVGS